MDIGERISQTVQVDQDAGWDGLQLDNYNKIWRKLDLRNRNSRKAIPNPKQKIVISDHNC